MTAQENILAQLERLIEHGAMPKSACSGSLLKFVRPLLDAKVLVEERSGGGRRLAVPSNVCAARSKREAR